jgi:Protein of unknown function (DUF2971)
MPKEETIPSMAAANDGIPGQVFHFTSIDTLMKIVDTKSIWCTAIPYLNDRTERSFLINAVAARLPALKVLDSSLDRTLSVDIEAIEERDLLTPLGKETFVASFSLGGDSLMHWRAYCPQQSGVAIGFRTDCLSAARIKEVPVPGMLVPPIALGKISYIDINDTSVVDGVIYTAVQIAKRWFESSSEYPGKTLSSLFRLALESFACATKHSSFEVEGEYRLLLGNVRRRENNIRFRTVRSSLIPYVEVEIPSHVESGFTFDQGTIWNAIGSVVVGPTANMDLTQASIKGFFALRGMSVEVTGSEIPYRDW